jgi:hypothetical protein
LLAKYDELPQADTLPPGALVLSLSGTERTDIKWGFWLWSGSVLVGGVVLGYWMAKRGEK